ncbi:MAG: polyprenyl synthetase family protein [Pseudomonadota bacterium]
MFTKSIYKTILKAKIKAVDKRLLQLIQSPTIPQALHPILTEATQQGRRFRSLLLLVTNTGVGGDWRDAIDLACAIELLHKASLIHDDLIDGDSLRRGMPTFWKTQGEKQAIIVGDVLIGLAFKTVSQWCRTNNIQFHIFEAFSNTLNETALGELLDLQFELMTNVDAESIENMSLLKSGSLIAASMKIGALSGGAPPAMVETLTHLGWQMGFIFQMMNDLNNISGRDVYSKGSLGCDLVQNKKNIVTVALEQAGISFEDLPNLPENRLTDALKPVVAEIDNQIYQAEANVAKLPDNAMKKLFGKLLQEAKEEWFWVE